MSNQTILITGGGRGIGKGLVETFSKRGHTVFYTIRKDADDLPSSGTPLIADVTDKTSLEHAFSDLPTIDILINNAGILNSFTEPAAQVSEQDMMDTFNVNVVGPMRVTQAILPKLQSGSRVVNISSGMGQLSEMGSGALSYRVSKTALNALTKVFANELQGQGILVNTICPGWVQTDMGGSNATLTVEESVASIADFALSDNPGTGTFTRHGQSLDW